MTQEDSGIVRGPDNRTSLPATETGRRHLWVMRTASADQISGSVGATGCSSLVFWAATAPPLHLHFVLWRSAVRHPPPSPGTPNPQASVRRHPNMALHVVRASASSDMIRWSRVLLSHTLDAARSY